MPRLRIILDQGESRPFDPFDRFAQFESSKGKKLEDLLDEFSSLRGENVANLKRLGLRPEQFALKGSHPALGTVTLGQLLATWVVHDLTHIVQISRVMAKRYGEDVGPWRAYLSELNKYRPVDQLWREIQEKKHGRTTGDRPRTSVPTVLASPR